MVEGGHLSCQEADGEPTYNQIRNRTKQYQSTGFRCQHRTAPNTIRANLFKRIGIKNDSVQLRSCTILVRVCGRIGLLKVDSRNNSKFTVVLLKPATTTTLLQAGVCNKPGHYVLDLIKEAEEVSEHGTKCSCEVVLSGM